MKKKKKKKKNNRCFRPALTQTDLYNHRRRLEALNLDLRRGIGDTRVAKTKALISCAVTAQLICAFVFGICRLLLMLCGGSYKPTRLALKQDLF